MRTRDDRGDGSPIDGGNQRRSERSGQTTIRNWIDRFPPFALCFPPMDVLRQTLQISQRRLFLSPCNSKRSTIMSTSASNFGIFESTSILSKEEFTALFRAVHFVAARKEKRPESTASPRKEKSIDGLRSISDVTNIPNRSSKILDNPENTPAVETNFTKLIERRSPADWKTPFQRFRGRYLIVSDFTSQLWCEQQMDYNFDPPTGVEIKPKPQMATGTDLHLARELEIQEIVEVDVTSREDAFALKLLNLIACVRDFSSGEHSVRREVPIFGTPFNLDLFVVGIIDEVRFDGRSRRVDIVELKTRLAARLPSRSQKKTHDLQVMLYRRMWDDLVTGQLTKMDVLKHMKLSPNAELGQDLCTQIRSLGILRSAASITLDALLDEFFDQVKKFSTAGDLFVEYCHQETKECFAVESVEYDEKWLRQKLEQSSSYWRGERNPVGVEIEEAWKCKFCDFADVCAWRMKKQEECSSKNRENFIGATVLLPSPSTSDTG